jgi:hypothetical protein
MSGERFTVTRNTRVGGWTVTDNTFPGPWVAGEPNGERTVRTQREAGQLMDTFRDRPWWVCVICQRPGTRENPLREGARGAYHSRIC